MGLSLLQHVTYFDKHFGCICFVENPLYNDRFFDKFLVRKSHLSKVLQTPIMSPSDGLWFQKGGQMSALWVELILTRERHFPHTIDSNVQNWKVYKPSKTRVFLSA